MMKAIRTWIVVADGARARFLENTGPGKGLGPADMAPLTADHKSTRELGAERPGRVHDRMGEGRHAMEPPVDWHRSEKAKFAHEVAAKLNRSAQDNAFDRLVLIAPAKTLGDLRAALDRMAADRVTAEVPKDFTTLPENELAVRLDEILAH